MANDILYDLTPWQDAPSTLTPINAENLNARDSLLKKVVDKTNQLQEQLDNLQNGGTGLTDEAIELFDEIGNHLPFNSSEGGTLWNKLILALRGEITATLVSISATYLGGEETVGTALTDLTGLSVIANYDDGTTVPVVDYTLSGTIAEGENIITVSYKGMTDTFTVTGTTEEVEPTVTYTITNNLTNATTSDATTTVVIEGGMYSANITANTGYVLDTVTVTMGGADITSTAYADGTINISNVTGDIVITAVATEEAVEENNGWEEGVAYSFEFVNDGYELNATTGELAENTSFAVSDYLPCRGVDAYDAGTDIQNIVFYDADKNFLHSGGKAAYPNVVGRDAYYFRISARKSYNGTKTITPHKYPTLTEGMAYEIGQKYTVTRNEGYYINVSTGAKVTSDSHFTSDYMLCYGATTLGVVTGNEYYRKWIAFYDSEKNFISGYVGNNSTHTIPDGATYFTVSAVIGATTDNPWIELS